MICFQDLDDKRHFRDFYLFTFNFAKNPNQKSLEPDMALAYWGIVLKGRFQHLDLWLNFVQVCYLGLTIRSIKGVPLRPLNWCLSDL